MKSNKAEYCEACKKVTGKIKTRRGFVCWDCYKVELKIFEKQDWRDVKLHNYIKENNLNQKKGEVEKNMVNRNKVYLANKGFIFK